MSVAAIAQPHLSRMPEVRVRPLSAANRVEPLVFSAAPALFAASSFATGVLVPRLLYVPPPLAFLAAMLAAAIVILASRIALRSVLLPLFLAWALSGLFCAEVYPRTDPQTALLAYASSAMHTFDGELVRAGPVRVTESTAPFAQHGEPEKSQLLDIHVESMADSQGKTIPVTGGLRLSVYAPFSDQFRPFRCGQRLRVTASIHAPERYNDPGVWDSAAYLRGQGIGALASAKVDAVSVQTSSNEASFSCRLRAAQQAAGERIMVLGEPTWAVPTRPHLPSFFRLSTEDASMLAAMITGDRVWLQRRTRVGFERTGSFHLLVVSGLHLAIFAGLIFWLAQKIRLPRLWATLLTIVAALAYAIFTGYGQPVQRSFWMVTLYLLARLLWRERSALNAIGFAGLCLLAANPPASSTLDSR